jgi:hypothetical protein
MILMILSLDVFDLIAIILVLEIFKIVLIVMVILTVKFAFKTLILVLTDPVGFDLILSLLDVNLTISIDIGTIFPEILSL